MSKIKEILCLHHSHLDIGYTHPQPLLMELQSDYIDEAIDLCLITEDFPEESKFRWTCEATYPVLKWLETASVERIEIFKRLLRNNQISIAAMLMHTTPLCHAEQLTRMLYPVKELRRKFDIPINTAINHDVNGQPWPISQILLDAGVEFYITGINIHFGGIPFNRPTVFKWETPDNRNLLTFQGEHYSLFSQFFETSLSDTQLMANGIKKYVQRLEDNGYEHDFVYLTSTNPPLMDNNCPDPELSGLIRKYNEEGHEYKIRFVTPEMLLKKVKGIKTNKIPSYSGDWTDYWNFGSGSSAKETRLNRKTKQGLKKAELLESLLGSPGERYNKIKSESFHNAFLYDEHTWGAAHSISEPDHPEVDSQRIHKSHTAYQAADLSAYVLGKQMEALAENPLQSKEPDGIVLVNTSSVSQKVPLNIPDDYFVKGRHLAAARIKQFLPYGRDQINSNYFGTIEVDAFSWKRIPFNELKQQELPPEGDQLKYTVTEDSIETPFYKMIFDSKKGRIKQLFDKKRNWAMLDEQSDWTLFEFIRESIDSLHHTEERTTFFPRDVELGNNSISVWNHDWKSRRTGAEELLKWNIEKTKDTVTFVMKLRARGVSQLEQRITFSVHHSRIECAASFNKEDIRTPESIYFAFPLNLQKGWRSHFDTAGMFVELDQEQIGTVSKDWVTVDQTVSVYDQYKGVTLACPDAPLIQIGDFNFGKESKHIERTENPLLLAWPMNNFWDTNFWISQPGRVQFKYELSSFDKFEPEESYKAGISAINPVEMNASADCYEMESGQLFDGNGENIVPLYIKPAEDKNGMIIMLRNLSDQSGNYVFSLPNRKIVSAFVVNTLEETVKQAKISNGRVQIQLQGKELTQLRVIMETI